MFSHSLTLLLFDPALMTSMFSHIILCASEHCDTAFCKGIRENTKLLALKLALQSCRAHLPLTPA